MITSEAPFFNTHSSIASPDVMIEDADKKSRTWRGFMPGCSRPNNGDRFFLLNKTKQNKNEERSTSRQRKSDTTRRQLGLASSPPDHHHHHPVCSPASPFTCPHTSRGGVRLDRLPVSDRIDLCGCAHAMRAWLLRQVTKRQRRRGHMLRSPDTHARPPSAPLN